MKRSVFALALALCLMLGGCGGEKEPVVSSPEPSTTPPVVSVEPSPSDEPPVYEGARNPLTNEPISDDFVGKRPLAVMLSNIRAAQPQQGIAQVDIIYEVIVEGGITRMVGIFQEYDKMQMTGSVRSARPCYLDLALGHDAIYLHAGGSEAAYSLIKSRGVTALDCVRGPYEGTIFWRDATRRSNNGYTHSVVTSGEAIMQYLPALSFRQEHEEGYEYEMKFSDSPSLNGSPAIDVKVPFSGVKTGYFHYDEDARAYMASQSLDGYAASDYIDGNSNEQIGFSNVLILFTKYKSLDSEDRQEVTLTGKGEGYFLTGGSYIPITWEKDSYDSQFHYTDAKGREITFTTGKTYVNIVKIDTPITFE